MKNKDSLAHLTQSYTGQSYTGQSYTISIRWNDFFATSTIGARNGVA